MSLGSRGLWFTLAVVFAYVLISEVSEEDRSIVSIVIRASGLAVCWTGLAARLSTSIS